MDDIDALRRRLADIQDELIAAASDDFALRYSLRTEQAALRDRVAVLSADFDLERETPELEQELKALRGQLEAAQKSRIDLVQQAGGGSHAGSGAASYEIGVNRAIDEAQGVSALQRRIAAIERVVERRAT